MRGPLPSSPQRLPADRQTAQEINGLKLSWLADQPLINGLSVSLDEGAKRWHGAAALQRDDWPQVKGTLEAHLHAALNMFDQAQVKATFFVYGWMAQEGAGLLRLIAGKGHEVASHGWDCYTLGRNTPQAFHDDLRRARSAIEDACGQTVSGYRAPGIALGRTTPWVHRVLADDGYSYSSSITPVVPDHYGWEGAHRFAFRPVQGADILEIPVTSGVYASRSVSSGKTGLFQLMPYSFTRRSFQGMIRTHSRPMVFHFRPWDVASEVLEAEAAKLPNTLKNCVSSLRTTPKLQRLMNDFSWGRMDHLAWCEGERLGDLSRAPISGITEDDGMNQSGLIFEQGYGVASRSRAGEEGRSMMAWAIDF